MDDLNPQANEPSDPDQGQPAETPAQPQQPAPPAAATQANALAGRQAAFDAKAATQSWQGLSAVRQELGLAKNASVDDIKAAIASLRQPTYVDDENLDDLDPVLAGRLRQSQDALWRANEQIYGDLLVGEAKTLYDAARRGDAASFVEAAAQFVIAVTDVPGGPDEGAPQSETPPPALGGEEPSVGAQPARQGGQPDSGDMLGFIRNQAAKLGLG